MSLLTDAIKGQAGKSLLGSLGSIASSGAMAQVASSLLQQHGGIAGLIEKLGKGGLATQVQSWIGNTPNQPVTGAQLTQALGADSMTQIGQELGVEPQQAAGTLAGILPELVNHLTPGGKLPTDAAKLASMTSISSALTAIAGKF